MSALKRKRRPARVASKQRKRAGLQSDPGFVADDLMQELTGAFSSSTTDVILLDGASFSRRRARSTFGSLSATEAEARHVVANTYLVGWGERWLQCLVIWTVAPVILVVVSPVWVLLRCFPCIPWPYFLPVGLKQFFGRATTVDDRRSPVHGGKSTTPVSAADIAKREAACETVGVGWAFPWKEDNGLYWFGMGNKCSKGPDSCYFDPSKPTVIYLHGWEPGTTQRGFRETINWRWGDPLFSNTDTLDLWIHRGYNCGIFYWNGQSDELENADAERKIFNTSGRTCMRYRYRGGADGNDLWYGPPLPEHDKPVSEQVLDAYIEHFGGRSNMPPQSVRIVGHSLGCQLSLEFLRLLSLKRTEKQHQCLPFPSRLSLLDPYFTAGRAEYLPKDCNGNVHTNASWGSEILEMLATTSSIAMDTYLTSLIGRGWLGGSAKAALHKHTVVNSVGYRGVHWTSIKTLHICAVHLYFVSIVVTNADVGALKTGLITYAGTSDKHVRSVHKELKSL